MTFVNSASSTDLKASTRTSAYFCFGLGLLLLGFLGYTLFQDEKHNQFVEEMSNDSVTVKGKKIQDLSQAMQKILFTQNPGLAGTGMTGVMEQPVAPDLYETIVKSNEKNPIKAVAEIRSKIQDLGPQQINEKLDYLMLLRRFPQAKESAIAVSLEEITQATPSEWEQGAFIEMHRNYVFYAFENILKLSESDEEVLGYFEKSITSLSDPSLRAALLLSVKNSKPTLVKTAGQMMAQLSRP